MPLETTVHFSDLSVSSYSCTDVSLVTFWLLYTPLTPLSTVTPVTPVTVRTLHTPVPPVTPVTLVTLVTPEHPVSSCDFSSILSTSVHLRLPQTCLFAFRTGSKGISPQRNHWQYFVQNLIKGWALHSYTLVYTWLYRFKAN